MSLTTVTTTSTTALTVVEDGWCCGSAAGLGKSPALIIHRRGTFRAQGGSGFLPHHQGRNPSRTHGSCVDGGVDSCFFRGAFIFK